MTSLLTKAGSHAVFLSLAVVGVLASYGGFSMGLGSLRAPEPGMWPFLTGSALSLFSLLGLATPTGSEVEEPAPAVRTLALALTCCAGFILGLALLGLLPSAAVALSIWFRGISRLSWLRSIGYALVMTVVLHLLFVVGLNVPLPGLLSQV